MKAMFNKIIIAAIALVAVPVESKALNNKLFYGLCATGAVAGAATVKFLYDVHTKVQQQRKPLREEIERINTLFSRNYEDLLIMDSLNDAEKLGCISNMKLCRAKIKNAHGDLSKITYSSVAAEEFLRRKKQIMPEKKSAKRLALVAGVGALTAAIAYWFLNK